MFPFVRLFFLLNLDIFHPSGMIVTAGYYGESVLPRFPPRLSPHATARAGTLTPGPDMAAGPLRTEPRSTRLPQRAPAALQRPHQGARERRSPRLSVAAAGSLADFAHPTEVRLVGPIHH